MEDSYNATNPSRDKPKSQQISPREAYELALQALKNYEKAWQEFVDREARTCKFQEDDFLEEKLG